MATRIHFTEADLRNITVAQRPDVLMETVLVTRAVAGFAASAPIRRQLPAWRAGLRQAVQPAFALVAPDGATADELPDGFGVAHDIDTAVASVLELPDRHLRAELEAAGVSQRPGSWAARLAAGEREARHALAVGLRLMYQVTLSPLETSLHDAVSVDRARRADALLDCGIDSLLNGLHPDIEWQAPTLVCHCPRLGVPDVDLYLDGTGLQLYPSPVAAGVLWGRSGGRPRIVYPITDYNGSVVRPSEWLAALVGRTRARVLCALQTSGSTAQLARRTGISNASASEHTRVLRESGLVATQRLPGYALHSLTPLGVRLLDSA